MIMNFMSIRLRIRLSNPDLVSSEHTRWVQGIQRPNPFCSLPKTTKSNAPGHLGLGYPKT